MYLASSGALLNDRGEHLGVDRGRVCVTIGGMIANVDSKGVVEDRRK
jgi:hypothetical protein